MSPHDREDLPQVAQYLAVNYQSVFPGIELTDYLRRELLRRFPRPEMAEAVRDDLLRQDPPPADPVTELRRARRKRSPGGAGTSSAPGVADLIRGATSDELLEAAGLDELVSAAGALRRAADPFEPHQVLASLPCEIYLTTNFDRLMFDALARTPGDKAPKMDQFNWRDEVKPEGSVFADNPSFRPSKDEPLVYHLHGRFNDPTSLVLKEDDYFDYLIGSIVNKKNIPPLVRRATTDSALLLLGFQMNDWDFRVLFRSILSQEGATRLSKYAHVAVQIDPQGDRILDPNLARRYLQRYVQDAKVSIYWGRVEDFVKELDATVEGVPGSWRRLTRGESDHYNGSRREPTEG